jgi:ATP-dependent protease ClpP protease subunit
LFTDFPNFHHSISWVNINFCFQIVGIEIMMYLIRLLLIALCATISSISIADQIDTYSCSLRVTSPVFKSWIPSNIVFNKRDAKITVMYPKNITYKKLRVSDTSKTAYHFAIETVAKLNDGRKVDTISDMKITRTTYPKLTLNFRVPELRMKTIVYGDCKIKTTYIKSPTCSENASYCGSFELCRLATFIDGNYYSWRTSSTYNQFVVEARSRNLSCRVGEFVSKPPSVAKTKKTISEKCYTNVSLCSTIDLCEQATYQNGNQYSWKTLFPFKKYIIEAKKRNLTCGVGESRTKTSTYTKSPTCSENISYCGSIELCRKATTWINGDYYIWKTGPSSKKYIIEAKKRKLTCGVGKYETNPTTKTEEDRTPPATTTDKPSSKSKEDWLRIYGEYKEYGAFVWFKRIPNALFLRDKIRRNDIFDFRKAIKKHKNIDVVVLNSHGGSVVSGLLMAATINDKGIGTYIHEDFQCESACSFMFFAGNPRYSKGKLGVHQVYTPNAAQKENKNIVEQETQYTASEIISFLNDFDTPSFVYEEMFASPNMYYFNDEEIREINSTNNDSLYKDIDSFLESIDK